MKYFLGKGAVEIEKLALKADVFFKVGHPKKISGSYMIQNTTTFKNMWKIFISVSVQLIYVNQHFQI